MRQLRIAIWDIDRFVDNIASMVNVRVLNFSAQKLRRIIFMSDVTQSRELIVDQLRIVVRFIKAFQAVHGSDRPYSSQIFNLDAMQGGEEALMLEREFYQLLPPIPPPTKLNKNNWSRMSARYEDVDLSQVDEIAYYDTVIGWPDRQNKVLERCKSLEVLHCLGLERDMFVFSKALPSGWCCISDLNLHCNGFIMRDLIDTAMELLHGSLTKAIFAILDSSSTQMDPDLSIGKNWSSFPVLRTLHIRSKETIYLHPHALHDAPVLESIFLQDATNVYNPHTLTLFEPWRLPNLQSLYLDGMAAVCFHPHSFAGIPRLTNATIKGVKINARRFFMSRRRDNTPRGMPSAELWTWDWPMPELVSLRMEGEPAYRFDFQWLEFCPKLSDLALLIGGHRRPLLLSPLITSRDKLVAEHEKMKGRPTLQQFHLGEDKGLYKNDHGASEAENQQLNNKGEQVKDEQGCKINVQALREIERRGLLCHLVRQRWIKDDEFVDSGGDDNGNSKDDDNIWIRSKLLRLELHGRWLISDRLLHTLLYRNLRFLRTLVLKGPKGYTHWGLLSSTRHHHCLGEIESSQLMTRADGRLFHLEGPGIRHWTGREYRGGIQEWNSRPVRDAVRAQQDQEYQQVNSNGGDGAMPAQCDWEVLNPEKVRRTKIPRWEWVEEIKECSCDVDSKKKEEKKAKAREDGNALLVSNREPGSGEDDGAPGPSSLKQPSLANDQPQQDQQAQVSRTALPTECMDEAVEKGYIVYKYGVSSYRFETIKKLITECDCQ
ncbi:hypothetical protein BGW42_002821 [Actinomortierella wolfii]|nr:hypothetical protein BGW42_002821 [Actinomortierella wolfii]